MAKAKDLLTFPPCSIVVITQFVVVDCLYAFGVGRCCG
jgi:hypothetical protein